MCPFSSLSALRISMSPFSAPNPASSRAGKECCRLSCSQLKQKWVTQVGDPFTVCEGSFARRLPVDIGL